MDNRPVLSIAILTYNHEAYIRQCLDSVFGQKLNVSFEVVIADDCSPDNNRAIIAEYEARYPGVIRKVYSEKNQGFRQTGWKLFNAVEGDFVAFVEGDDYWSDEYKLQKQLDLLHQHPDQVMNFHPAEVLDERTGSTRFKVNIYPPEPVATVTNIHDLLADGNYIPSAGRVHRNVFRGNYPELIAEDDIIADYALNLLLALHGNIGFIEKPMSVYRVHGGGVTTGFNFKREYRQMTNLLNSFNAYTQGKYADEVDSSSAKYIYGLLDIALQEKNRKDALKHIKGYYRTRKYQKGFSMTLFLKTWLRAVRL